MASKASPRSRPSQRKRRRSNDSYKPSSQQPEKSKANGAAESEIVVASSSTKTRDESPQAKRVKTNATATSNVRKIKHISSSYDGVQEEEVEGSNTTPEKHVHFPNNRADGTTVMAETNGTSRASRASLSPFATRKKPGPRDGGRASLPPTLTGSPVPIKELNFSPLRDIIDERMRRRLRRSHLSEEVNNIEDEKKTARKTNRTAADDLSRAKDEIKQLQLDLEIQRQLGIDIGTEADERTRNMEDELANLKQSMQEMQETHDQHEPDFSPQDTNVDDEPGVSNFFDPDDIPVSPPSEHPVEGDNRGVVNASTQVSFPDTAWEHEREGFEQALAKLHRQLSDAQSTLQILNIELSGLGFDDGAETLDPHVIITSIRDAFHQTYAELEVLLPDAISEAASNKHLLALLVQSIRSLLNSVHKSESDIQNQKDMEELLKSQCNDLLEQLTDSQMRNQMLEDQWHELDSSNEHKERRVVELDELVAELQNAIQERETLIQAKDDQILPLEKEVEQQSRDLEKLRDALSSYRAEVKQLESLITRLETDHADQIGQLRDDHEGRVNQLNQALETEKQNLSFAELDLDSKTAMITALELRLEEEGSRVDNLKVELADAMKDLSLKQSQLDTADADLQTKAAFVDRLQDQLMAFESNLEETRVSLDTMNQDLESERQQRKSVEGALDGANENITRLDQEVKNSGIQANELRQKIFELQVSKDKAIKELNEETAQIQDKLQQDLTNEMTQRKEAEQHIDDLSDELGHLRTRLIDTECEMATAVKEKDTIIQAQASELNTLRTNLDATSTRLTSTADELDTLKQLHHKDVTVLRTDVYNAYRDIELLTCDLENLDGKCASQTRDLDKAGEVIEGLERDLKTEKTLVQKLQGDKTSLEQRVQEEAEAMLHAQSKAADRIGALLEEVDGCQEDVKDLNMQVAFRDSKIVTLEKGNKDLRSKLERAVRVAGEVMGRVKRGVDELGLVVEDEAEEMEAMEMEVLEEPVEEVEEKVEEKATVLNVSNHTAVGSQVKKLREKERKVLRDSGIGMNSSP